MARSGRGTDAPVLSRRALNRALMARQMLFERQGMPVADAITHLIAIQAQVPTDPYIGLWSRLRDFDPEALSSLIAERKAVRMTSLRGTVHLTTAGDARILRPWVQPLVTRLLASTPFGKATRDVDRARLAEVAEAVVNKAPVTLAKLRPALAAAFPGYNPTDLSYVFHYTRPLVQVPPRGLWGKSSAPRVTTLESWLGQALGKPSPEKIVLRYLAAYGPASVADVRAWSGVTNLGPLFEKLRPRLVTYRDERATELFDLPGMALPDPDTPVPPRFLPVYDNATLGFANRDRIIAGGPKTPPPQNAWVKSFLVDGFVSGFWSIAETKTTATLTLQPFAPVGRKDQAALAAEGRALLKFATGKSRHEVAFAAP